jgi:uncharacterized protein YjiS (DUF1127 family)
MSCETQTAFRPLVRLAAEPATRRMDLRSALKFCLSTLHTWIARARQRHALRAIARTRERHSLRAIARTRERHSLRAIARARQRRDVGMTWEAIEREARKPFWQAGDN